MFVSDPTGPELLQVALSVNDDGGGAGSENDGSGPPKGWAQGACVPSYVAISVAELRSVLTVKSPGLATKHPFPQTPFWKSQMLKETSTSCVKVEGPPSGMAELVESLTVMVRPPQHMLALTEVWR